MSAGSSFRRMGVRMAGAEHGSVEHLDRGAMVRLLGSILLFFELVLVLVGTEQGHAAANLMVDGLLRIR